MQAESGISNNSTIFGIGSYYLRHTLVISVPHGQQLIFATDISRSIRDREEPQLLTPTSERWTANSDSKFAAEGSQLISREGRAVVAILNIAAKNTLPRHMSLLLVPTNHVPSFYPRMYLKVTFSKIWNAAWLKQLLPTTEIVKLSQSRICRLKQRDILKQ